MTVTLWPSWILVRRRYDGRHISAHDGVEPYEAFVAQGDVAYMSGIHAEVAVKPLASLLLTLLQGSFVLIL